MSLYKRKAPVSKAEGVPAVPASSPPPPAAAPAKANTRLVASARSQRIQAVDYTNTLNELLTLLRTTGRPLSFAECLAPATVHWDHARLRASASSAAPVCAVPVDARSLCAATLRSHAHKPAAQGTASLPEMLFWLPHRDPAHRAHPRAFLRSRLLDALQAHPRCAACSRLCEDAWAAPLCVCAHLTPSCVTALAHARVPLGLHADAQEQQPLVQALTGCVSEHPVMGWLRTRARRHLEALPAERIPASARVGDTDALREEKQRLRNLRKHAAATCARKALNDAHIEWMHRYNETKDVAQALLGQLARLRNAIVRDLYEDFGLSLTD